jgi:glycosyltransferase involved in cell wall biosynthesis/peptidoglycan/xylan/chitin deacetylase (PgdA/CDA1 family)
LNLRRRDDLLTLCYHAVSESWPADLSITPERLETQLTKLRRKGYHSTTLAAAAAQPQGGRTLVVSFDDAFASIFSLAYPILERLGMIATLYVSTAHVGGEPMRWDGIDHWLDGPHEDELRGMSGEQIRELADAGWEIGSHTRTHPHLPELGAAALREELVLSKRECEELSGSPCRTLAYPYGELDAGVEEAAAAAGYEAAVTLAPGTPGGGRLRLPRTGVYARDGSLRFALKSSPWARRALEARRQPPAAPVEPAPPPPPRDLPRVAVIVPCYGDGATVGATVASIDEDEQVELVVVDDCSPDAETHEVLRELEADGVRIARHQRNRGVSAARMTGLARTSARYVFPLDSDDQAVPGSLGRMADALDRDPTAAACYGDVVEFGESYEIVRRVERSFDPYVLAYRNRYPIASMFRRATLERLGGWRPIDGIDGHQDWNLWMTLAEAGERVFFIEGLLAFRYRVHGERGFRKAARNRRALYRGMRRTHPALFAELRRHRRESSLPPVKRRLYPLLYGYRPNSGLKRRLEGLLFRLRVRGKRR